MTDGNKVLKCVVEHVHNKAFKSDSQRMAFFIPSLGFVFTGQWFRFGGSVAHTLMRRYVALSILVFISSCLWPTARRRLGWRKVWRALCYRNVCVQCRFRSLGFPYTKAIFVAGRLNPRALAVLHTQFREPLWAIWLQQDLLFVRLFLGGKLNLKVRLHNKAFKRDLARVAFLVCSLFSD